jgi:pyruvate/2-oxoglutarate dehydrogenase complex dihydrolipoamide acyltransferase (E2) component
MTSNSKRLLLVAVSAIALVLAIAPVSFAGESSGSPGPTQVGEIAGPTTPPPAQQTGPAAPAAPAPATAPAAPAASAPSTSNSTSHSTSHAKKSVKKSGVKGVSKIISVKDTVQAKGGIQAGLGGMATQPSSLPTNMALTIGLLFILAAAVSSTPLVRRSQD